MLENGTFPYLKPEAFEYIRPQLTVTNDEVSQDKLNLFYRSIENYVILNRLSNEGLFPEKTAKKTFENRYQEIQGKLDILGQIERHCNDEKYHESVISQLKLIYLYWNASYEEQKINIILEMAEDIDACTPGFNIRLKKILTDLSNPGTLLHSLQSYRKKILLNQVYETYSGAVHHYNFFLHMADILGFGVKGDPNESLPKNKKSEVGPIVLKAMAREYEPIRILLDINLYDRLIKQLKKREYCGRLSSKEYKNGKYDCWVKYIKYFLNLDDNSGPDLEKFLITNDDYQVIDISKDYLREFLFETLCERLFCFSNKQKKALKALLLPTWKFEKKHFDVLCAPLIDEKTNKKIAPAIIQNQNDCFALLNLMGQTNQNNESCKQTELAIRYLNHRYCKTNQTNKSTLQSLDFLYQLSIYCNEEKFKSKLLSDRDYNLYYIRITQFKNKPESIKQLLTLLIQYKEFDGKFLCDILHKYLRIYTNNFQKIKQINELLNCPAIKAHPNLKQYLSKYALKIYGTLFYSREANILRKLPEPEKNPVFYELIDKVINEEQLYDLLSQNDEDNNHVLMRVYYCRPEAIEPMAKLFQKISIDKQQMLFQHTNNHGVKFIDMIFNNLTHAPFIMPLITAKFLYQSKEKEKLASLMILPDDSGQNLFMRAILNAEKSEPNLWIEMIDNQPRATLTQLLMQHNSKGCRALDLALEKQNELWINLIFKILQTLDPGLQFEILMTCDHERLRSNLVKFPSLCQPFQKLIKRLDSFYQTEFALLLPDFSARVDASEPLKILYQLIINNDPEVCSDPQQMMAAVTEINGNLLEYASPALKQDIKLIVAAIKQNPSALQFVAEALRNQEQIQTIASIQNDIERAEACDALIEKLSLFDGYQPFAIIKIRQLIDERKEIKKQSSLLDLTMYFNKKQPDLDKQVAVKLLGLFQGENPYFTDKEKETLMKPEFKDIWCFNAPCQQKVEALISDNKLTKSKQLHFTLKLSTSDDMPAASSSSGVPEDAVLNFRGNW